MQEIADILKNSTPTPRPSPLTAPPKGLPRSGRLVEAVCDICGGLGYYKEDLPPGHSDFGKMLPCPCQVPARLAQLADLSGLKEHEKDLRLADLYAFNAASRDLIQVVQGFIESPRGWLYIWGPPGNGKTLALQVVVNEMLDRGVSALYITFSDLLDLMRETFGQRPSRGDTFWYRFQRLLTIEVLAIDEFDKVNQTGFAREFQSKLADHRYRGADGCQTATLFAGNEDPAHLPDWIADRVHDGRFQVVHNVGRSVRAALAWEPHIPNT
jgi:hypothetical protein